MEGDEPKSMRRSVRPRDCFTIISSPPPPSRKTAVAETEMRNSLLQNAEDAQNDLLKDAKSVATAMRTPSTTCVRAHVYVELLRESVAEEVEGQLLFLWRHT